MFSKFSKLYRTIFDANSERTTHEMVFFDTTWLAAHVDCGLSEFYANYTSEDVDALMGEAILAGAIPFTYAVDRDNPIEFYSMDESAGNLLLNCAAHALANSGFDAAAEAFDEIFNLGQEARDCL